jgi:uncharacterized protein (TIGR03000 family)
MPFMAGAPGGMMPAMQQGPPGAMAVMPGQQMPYGHRVIIIGGGCHGGGGCCGGIIVGPSHHKGKKVDEDEDKDEDKGKDKDKDKDKGKGKDKDKDDDDVSAQSAPARLSVSLPAEARLTIDGVATRSTGSARTFVTPTLPAGKNFSYTLGAVINGKDGKPLSWAQKVKVRAGKTTTVTMTPPTGVASR